MATVYLAQDAKHERLVALKVLHPDLTATLGPDRFLREMNLAARLNHPHPSCDHQRRRCESIAQRSTINNNSVRTFLTTTHRDISNPEHMPDPQLLDYQIKQVAAYLLSLRKQ